MSGYFTKDIAKESRTPEIVSLSSNPNYLEFESLNDSSQNSKIDISLEVLNTSLDVSKTKIAIVETSSKDRHELQGTRNRNEVSSTTFFIHEDKATTAENIRSCLLQDSFFRSNFKITTPFVNNVSSLDNGAVIRIQSLGAGVNYSFSFETLDSSFIRRVGNPQTTTNNDSIDGGLSNSEIKIELYKNTGIFLGVDDTPKSNDTIGTYITELTKAYYGEPVWYNLNYLIGNNKVFSNEFLNALGWCNTGTVTDYRAIARKSDGVNIESFYISRVLYALTGYRRNLEDNNLFEYVYNTQERNIVKPLTNRPTLTHIRGQRQYFNFILADPERGTGTDYKLGIMYKLYSQSKKLKATVVTHEQSRKLFNIVNTIELDLDGAIGDYENVGYIEVCLCRSGEQISETLGFSILPEFLYKVKDFAFLNSLGGWDSFNFGGVEKTEFKVETTTIFKTQTPAHSISSEIESVYSKEVTEQFVATSSPIKRNVVDWLKELSSSIVVYELSTKRIVIVDEFTLKPNSKDDLFTVEMKYHYSDSYNSLIK